MTERVLTTRELNRALLARQLLLERTRPPVTRALEPLTKTERSDLGEEAGNLATFMSGDGRVAGVRGRSRVVGG